MVLLIIINSEGVRLGCFSLSDTSTVQQLLLKLAEVNPELAQVQVIRNDALDVTYRLAEASTAQTLQQTRLVGQDATEETLVVLMHAGASGAKATAAVPPPAHDVEARILHLFASSGESPSAMEKHAEEKPYAHDEPVPMDEQQLELQRRLYAHIQQQQIDENLANALEYTPEAFAPVTMLYVPCTINQTPIKAFVDSGAQNSIMNKRTAEQCQLMRLVDVRMRGVAVGIGRQEIVGRIHMAAVNLAGMHIPFAFYVIEDQAIDLIIGLDQLKRHEMLIDLKKNCLTIGNVNVPFLGGTDVPAPMALDKEPATDGADEEGTEPTELPPPNATVATTSDAAAAAAAAAVVAASSSSSPPSSVSNVASRPAPVGGVDVPRHAPASVLSENERRTRLEGFMSFAGITDPRRALVFLEAAEWDPDGAAALFFGA